MMLVEAKASGQPLADELRMMNLPVLTFSQADVKVSRQNDKDAHCFSYFRIWKSVVS